MAALIEQVANNRSFDFGALAFGASETVEISANLQLEGATEATLEVAIHTLGFGAAAQRILVEAYAVVPDPDAPSDFVSATPLAQVVIRSSDTAGELLTDALALPLSQWVVIQVTGSQPVAGATDFSARLTVRLSAKRPSPEGKAVTPAVAVEPDRRIETWVLRPASTCYDPCGCDPYVPVRYVAPLRVAWPFPELPPEKALQFLPLIERRDATGERDYGGCGNGTEPGLPTAGLSAPPVLPPAVPGSDSTTPDAVDGLPRVFQQVVTLMDRRCALDPAVVAFEDAVALTPVLVAPRGDGRLLSVWDGYTQDGPGARAGALVPRARESFVGPGLSELTRVAGGPAPFALGLWPISARASGAPQGEGEFAVGFAVRPSEHLRSEYGVAAPLLPQYLDQWRAQGWRPVSVVAYGDVLSPKFAATITRDAEPWEFMLVDTRDAVGQELASAAEQGSVPVTVFRRWGGGYGIVSARARHRRCPPVHVEWDVRDDELEATLRIFACEGWRVVALIGDVGDAPMAVESGIGVVWTRDLFADARLDGGVSAESAEIEGPA